MLTSFSGTNRSGKLNIEYLAGQIMQRSNPGSSLSATSEFSDPVALAALLVSQIEAFLASNISTGFLILHFPFTYLDTVFELRKLLGPDLFKIAGILDSLASVPPSVCGSTTPHLSNSLCSHAVAARNDTQPNHLNKAQSRSDLPTTLKQQIYLANRQPKTGATSFAKADFVRARAIVRRTPKRTCDYPTIKLTPHRSFAHKSLIFLLDLRALQLIAFILIKYNYRRPKYPLPGRF